MTTLTVPSELQQTQCFNGKRNSLSTTLNLCPSAGRHCRSYKLEGQQGGNCQHLGAFVRGSCRDCALALPPFARSWEGLESSRIW